MDIAKKPDETVVQPEITIGMTGHVDSGKTTLLEKLSGKWTDTHSEEIKRGVTIRLGYANTNIYKCEKCDELQYSTRQKCEKCGTETSFVRKISFVDAPGHESLMATMLSGSAIMDAALLLIAANEECPQLQTKEHLMALSIIGVKNIIIVQNKIDLASEEQVRKNYEQIKAFIKGTIAENSPIIPVSAQHNINIDVLINTMQEKFATPKRDPTKDPLMFVARSFDVNKPGTEINELVGGILGGAIKEGTLKINDEIEIRPGLKVEKENKILFKPITTRIIGLRTGEEPIENAHPGGSIAILTELDPGISKSDSLTGNVVGYPGKMPEVHYEMKLEPKLLQRVVGTKEEVAVEPIKKGEMLMLNVNSAATTGLVIELGKNLVHVRLKRPVCASLSDRITISRLVGSRFRLIGYGLMK